MSVPTRGAAGRAAFNAKFGSPEEKRQYFSELASKGNAERVVLSADERQALATVYDLIRGIAKRHGLAEGEARDG